MKQIAAILKSYGEHHQNTFNKATHMVGVPTIVLSVMILTNWLYLMWPLIIITLAYYLYLSSPLGTILSFAFIILGFIADIIAPHPNMQGVFIFLSLFLGGWIIQFIGHGVEGKKPAFLDNARQILSAPLFIAHEILTLLKSKPLL